jgi:hypothetical protein
MPNGRCYLHGGRVKGGSVHRDMTKAWAARALANELRRSWGMKHPGGPRSVKRTLKLMDEAEQIGNAALEILPAISRTTNLSPLLVQGVEEGLSLEIETIQMVRAALKRDGELVDRKLLTIGNTSASVVCRLGMRAIEAELRPKGEDVVTKLLAAIRAEKATETHK